MQSPPFGWGSLVGVRAPIGMGKGGCAMRTHLVLALAFAGLMAPLAFAGCTAPVDSEEVDEETAAAAGELEGLFVNRYYSVRKNTDCMFRFCTGYLQAGQEVRAAAAWLDPEPLRGGLRAGGLGGR